MLVSEADPAGRAPDRSSLPPELQASVWRHQEHLRALVVSLRAAGVDESVVEASVKQLVSSYALELTAALQALVCGQGHD